LLVIVFVFFVSNLPRLVLNLSELHATLQSWKHLNNFDSEFLASEATCYNPPGEKG
jgi:hypothetical protein